MWMAKQDAMEAIKLKLNLNSSASVVPGTETGNAEYLKEAIGHAGGEVQEEVVLKKRGSIAEVISQAYSVTYPETDTDTDTDTDIPKTIRNSTSIRIDFLEDVIADVLTSLKNTSQNHVHGDHDNDGNESLQKVKKVNHEDDGMHVIFFFLTLKSHI